MAETVKIKVLKPIRENGKRCGAGDVLAMTAARAAAHVKAHVAEYVDRPAGDDGEQPQPALN